MLAAELRARAALPICEASMLPIRERIMLPPTREASILLRRRVLLLQMRSSVAPASECDHQEKDQA